MTVDVYHDDGEVELMIPTADAHAERRGIQLDPDEALSTAQDIIEAVDEVESDGE